MTPVQFMNYTVLWENGPGSVPRKTPNSPCLLDAPSTRFCQSVLRDPELEMLLPPRQPVAGRYLRSWKLSWCPTWKLLFFTWSPSCLGSVTDVESKSLPSALR